MSESEAKTVLILLIISCVTVAILFSQCAHITEKTWSDANNKCSNGVSVVYLDGDYTCKKVENNE